MSRQFAEWNANFLILQFYEDDDSKIYRYSIKIWKITHRFKLERQTLYLKCYTQIFLLQYTPEETAHTITIFFPLI